jgi:hypothetical protein
MKRVLLAVICVFLLHAAAFGAQHPFERGSTIFTFTAGFLSASDELYESYEGKAFAAILLMPSVTYFFVSRIGVGGDMLLFLTGQEDNKSTTLGAGPKMMFTFGSEEAKCYPYLTMGFYFIRHDMEYDNLFSLYDDIDITLTGWRGKIGIGTNYMLTRHLGLTLEGSYNTDSLELEDGGDVKTGEMFIVTLGFTGFFF